VVVAAGVAPKNGPAGGYRGGADHRPAITAPPASAPGIRCEYKDTEQFHICVGGPGLSRHDDRRHALRVLDTIFGGTSSSRLFQEVRERRGLAYSVYSFTSAFQDSGQVGLYVGTRPENVSEAMEIVAGEIERLNEQPATDDELRRAKENLKGRVLLALESTGARMSRLGSEVLAEAPLLDLDEMEAAIDAVTVSDLQELAAELWDPARLAVAGIGPDEERFADAVQPFEVAPAA
jgi:predicted Zn-dependent peptidase